MTLVEVIPFSLSQGDIKLKCKYFCKFFFFFFFGGGGGGVSPKAIISNF